MILFVFGVADQVERLVVGLDRMGFTEQPEGEIDQRVVLEEGRRHDLGWVRHARFGGATPVGILAVGAVSSGTKKPISSPTISCWRCPARA
jgi:hypothetical protein